MWHDILQLDVSVIEKLVRPVLIYGFLVIALRLDSQASASWRS